MSMYHAFTVPQIIYADECIVMCVQQEPHREKYLQRTEHYSMLCQITHLRCSSSKADVKKQGITRIFTTNYTLFSRLYSPCQARKRNIERFIELQHYKSYMLSAHFCTISQVVCPRRAAFSASLLRLSYQLERQHE